jgi:hypothetical protein
VAALFSLAYYFYGLEAEADNDLDTALNNYDGNLPYIPSRSTYR